MKILITSNFKKHFNTYVDFVDYYLLNYFEKKKIDTVIIPNKIEITKKKLLKLNNINLILLPGGNDVLKKSIFNKNRLKVEYEIIKFGIRKNIPIIGICRGMQVLNYFFNGKMKLINNHMRKKHRIFFKKNFFRKRSFIVNSYHSWGIPKKLMSKKFNIIAHDDEYNIEMFEHKKLNIIGTMWHPERETSYNNLNFIINKMKKKIN